MRKQKRWNIGTKGPESSPIATSTYQSTESESPGKTMRSAYCFGCGALHGQRVTTWEPSYEGGPGHFPSERENFWERLAAADYSEQPFGIIQEVGLGQGKSFKVVGHFNPDNDPDGFYPLVKARFLNAIREWVHKGWVTPQEVLDSLKGEA